MQLRYPVISLLFCSFIQTIFVQTLLAAPRELAKVTQPGMELTLSEKEDAQFSLDLRSAGIKVLNAFVVENPNRFVVDLVIPTLKQNKTVPILGSKEVSGVRIGVHPDKVRIVVDLKSIHTPSFTSEIAGDRVVVHFAFQGKVQGDTKTVTSLSSEATISPTSIPTFTKAVVITPPLAPTALASAAQAAGHSSMSSIETTTTNVPTLAPTLAPTLTSVPALPSATPTLIPPTQTPMVKATVTALMQTPTSPPTLMPTTMAPTHPSLSASSLSKESISSAPLSVASSSSSSISEIPTQALNIDPNKQELVGMSFEHFGAEQTPVLRLALSRRGEFRFTKIDDASYELLLPGYSLGANHLALPQFPPQDFEGMTFLKASPSKGGVQILIGIQRGIRLSPISKDSDVLVKIGG